jgi:hypothetical protein
VTTKATFKAGGALPTLTEGLKSSSKKNLGNYYDEEDPDEDEGEDDGEDGEDFDANELLDFSDYQKKRSTG